MVIVKVIFLCIYLLEWFNKQMKVKIVNYIILKIIINKQKKNYK